jgi:hypothetical protein
MLESWRDNPEQIQYYSGTDDDLGGVTLHQQEAELELDGDVLHAQGVLRRKLLVEHYFETIAL